ncbi:MAG: DNA/RNA non-specific endonuclease [Dorea sp.]|nr:DNA/RNA non-specific endonuclease [Sporofaciens musculi]MCI9423226.1 DNA/RNA non-specific endonuclease [Dorea sp.]
MMKNSRFCGHKKVYGWLLAVICCLFLTACAEDSLKSEIQGGKESISLDDIPEYSGEPYVEINGNEPDFPNDGSGEESFETYSELDSLGRCGVAYASVGADLMPTGERESISQVKPTGWQNVKYEHVDGKYLYNRCHLIGYQLSGENANERNLITGTRYMNVEGMLPFENMVADYVKETDCHVLYRVTPVFEGDNLLANGVQMEAYSVEDEGESISFNVFVYNVQPGVSIDYATGDNAKGDKDFTQAEDSKGVIRGNSRSKIYHCPGQAAYEEMEDSKHLVVFQTEEEAQNAGYRKAKR